MNEKHLQNGCKPHTWDGKFPCNIPDDKLHFPELRTELKKRPRLGVYPHLSIQ